ncbi:MAG: hypothetical protein JXB35_04705 [Anaerolineae bacterium]|nr:hypothetical protein [Anaerolineae bacterium]
MSHLGPALSVCSDFPGDLTSDLDALIREALAHEVVQVRPAAQVWRRVVKQVRQQFVNVHTRSFLRQQPVSLLSIIRCDVHYHYLMPNGLQAW